MKLEGKTALITGSDSGIGQATAIEFAKEGANVIITYFSDKEGAEETLKAVREQGREGIIVKVDVSEENQVEEMFDKAIEKFRTVDILMNNAAINAQNVQLADISTDDWQKIFRTNVDGYFFCSRRFINIRKKEGGKGKLINVTSVHEDIPMPGAAGYDSTKGAIRNLTRTLALEVAEDGINVNNLAPGMVLTSFNKEAKENEEVRKKKEQNIPMKRSAKPEEIARLAVFLASSDSDYVTGSTYFIDGGLMLNTGQGA